MAITSFIPQIWNANLLLKFRQQAIAVALANRQYEGDLVHGNKVEINTAVDIAIKDYATGTSGPRTTAADAVSTTSIELVVDQEKSFDFYVDDIDRVQAAGNMGAFTTSAGLGMAEDSDKYLLAQWVAADATPTLSAALTTGDQAFDAIRDLRKRLNKAHVPMGSRYILCNAEFEALLLDASSKLTSVNISGTSDALREAALGRLLGFTIVTTENMPDVTNAAALAVYTPAVAYVSQVQETEAMRAQDKFADRLRGLHVYGAKVVRPEGVAYITNATTSP